MNELKVFLKKTIKATTNISNGVLNYDCYRYYTFKSSYSK